MAYSLLISFDDACNSLANLKEYLTYKDPIQNNGSVWLIHKAARNKSPDCLQYLIDHKADVNVINAYGLAPIHVAARYNSYLCVNILIQNGANINIEPMYGGAPLLSAAAHDNKSMALVLLKHGAIIPKNTEIEWLNQIRSRQIQVVRAAVIALIFCCKSQKIPRDMRQLLAKILWKSLWNPIWREEKH